MASAPELVVWTSLWPCTLRGMADDIELRRRFGYALRRAIDHRGMSQRELARRLGVDPRRIAAMLDGRVLPNLFEAADLAAALGVSDELFRDPPEVPPEPPQPYYPLERYLLDVRLPSEPDPERVRRLAASIPPPRQGTRPPAARGGRRA